MVMSKHFFSEAGSIRHRKQEDLQPSLVALLKYCKQPCSKGFCFVLTSAGVLKQSMKLLRYSTVNHSHAGDGDSESLSDGDRDQT